jgi:endonuclease YncB( thermonuclease family)
MRPWVALIVSGVVIAIAAPTTARAADLDCSDFATQASAQDHFIALGGPAVDPDRLDGDLDGIACETLPCPCNSTGVPSSSGVPTPTATPQTAPPATRRAAQVRRVIDGDTLDVRLTSGSRLTVRLIGIDTSETKRPGVAVECGGKRASAYMQRLAFERGRGRHVTLISDASQDRTDRYGRTLAYVDARGTGDLGRRMVSAGWAAVYVFERPFARLARYEAASAAAKRGSSGVWGHCSGDFHRPA